MGFFDNLGGKLTNVGNQVSSKMKDSGEQFKLQSEIGNLQRQITQNYQQLGALYYQEYLNLQGNTSGLNQQFVAICQSIDALQASILDNQRKISQIKEQITCPGCGKSIPSDSAFCPFCGTRILHQAAPVAPNMAQPVTPQAATVNPAPAQPYQAAPQQEGPAAPAAQPADTAPVADSVAPAQQPAPADETPVDGAPAAQPAAGETPDAAPVSTGEAPTAQAAADEPPVDGAPAAQPAADEAATEAQAAAPAEETKPKFKYCTNCGAQLDIDAAFCTNCGAPQESI